MSVDEKIDEAPHHEEPRIVAEQHFCSCGGRLLLAGYGFVSKNGFWFERKCAKCKMKSVIASGCRIRPF
jgi:hypothetical protein